MNAYTLRSHRGFFICSITSTDLRTARQCESVALSLSRIPSLREARNVRGSSLRFPPKVSNDGSAAATLQHDETKPDWRTRTSSVSSLRHYKTSLPSKTTGLLKRKCFWLGCRSTIVAQMNIEGERGPRLSSKEICTATIAENCQVFCIAVHEGCLCSIRTPINAEKRRPHAS